MLTPFGKKCGKILIIVIVLICIIQFIAQYKPYTAPNFILVDKGGPEKPAYALSLHNEKSGYYKVECSSGCGDVKINDKINAQVAESGIIEAMSSIRGEEDFFTINSDTIMRTVQSTVNTMGLLISGIAFISLMVGGIGVMNIMLVSVFERTKEIGIRMAIGAKSRDILLQFLIEAILLCAIGGVIGVGLAYLVGTIVNALSSEFSMIFSFTSIIIAICVSSLIGIIFGYIPAQNASKLNPIDALLRD